MFSKSVNIFQSQWHVIDNESELHKSHDFILDASNTSVYGGVPYLFGIDPAWQMASNKIMFTNSYKEKISVILGVSQMLVGIILSLLNHLYFGHYLNIFCIFIPQILFLLSIFGYLCVIIIAKWVRPCDRSPAYYQCAPNLLIGFINMFMMQYPTGEDVHCSNLTWYPGQKELQICLVLLALVCALWMLLSKPLILLYRHKKSQNMMRLVEEPESPDGQQHQIDISNDQQLLSDSSTDANELSSSTAAAQTQQTFTVPLPKHEKFEGGEIFIHQAIHTIEFCLGCVSHTASYLRLWALSLAHSQLSEVLWNMVMRFAFTIKLPPFVGGLLAYPIFAVFAVLTVAILLVMEGLSAFLHTLRLHWVEFNSKFYTGEGVAFEPFSFVEILNKKEYA